MRRIIERVVTVVTTTTWKISWEADSPHSDHPMDPVSDDIPSPDVLSETVSDSEANSDPIETKEVDLPKREERVSNQTADE